MERMLMKSGLAILITSSLLLVGCKKEETEGASTGGGGGTTLFTASDISGGSSKTWTSNCVAQSDSVLGTSYYKQVVTLQSNGTFSMQTYAYVSPSTQYLSPCSNADYNTVFSVAGAYSVGSEVTSGVQGIIFVVTTSTVMATNSNSTTHTSIQDRFNTDCGGTSPYCTLSSGSCVNNGTGSGVSKNSSSMLCMNIGFPTSGNNTLYNLGSYSSGVLTLGGVDTGVPGVFNSGDMSAPSVVFH